MSINISSPTNDSVVFPLNFPTNSVLRCLTLRSNRLIFCTFNITKFVLLLPLCIFILHHGLQRWRQSRSTSAAATSHSDTFTYHLVAMETMSAFGCLLNVCAIYTGQRIVLLLGCFPLCFTHVGETFFHMLTCLERYLAVVHPITYLRLREERWIRTRNICIACVWLFSFVGITFLTDDGQSHIVMGNFVFMMLSVKVIFFCSVSVLCVLIRKGPGGGRERFDKSKKRAFYTILAILGVLMLRLEWDLVWATLQLSREAVDCGMAVWSFWVYIPSSLVLPVLFLLTKEKCRGILFCCVCFQN